MDLNVVDLFLDTSSRFSGLCEDVVGMIVDLIPVARFVKHKHEEYDGECGCGCTYTVEYTGVRHYNKLGRLDGTSTLLHDTGARETVEYRCGRKHGNAVVTFTDGAIQITPYVNGHRHGVEIYTYPGEEGRSAYRIETIWVCDCRRETMTIKDGYVMLLKVYAVTVHGPVKQYGGVIAFTEDRSVKLLEYYKGDYVHCVINGGERENPYYRIGYRDDHVACTREEWELAPLNHPDDLDDIEPENYDDPDDIDIEPANYDDPYDPYYDIEPEDPGDDVSDVPWREQ